MVQAVGVTAVVLGRNDAYPVRIKANQAFVVKDLLAGLPAGITCDVYGMGRITTVKQSMLGVAVGSYADPMIPLKATDTVAVGGEILLHFRSSTTAVSGAFTLLGTQFLAYVYDFTLPERPTLPMYMEIQSFGLLKGHKLDPNSDVSVQGPLTMTYVTELRKHRVEPFKQPIIAPNVKADGTLDLDQFGEVGGSFRQLVLNGAIAPVMFPTMFGPTSTDRPSIKYLQAIEKAIQSLGLKGAFTYLWDEPGTADYTEIVARAKLCRTYAPSMKIMVTTNPNATLAPYVDIFVPVFELSKTLAPGAAAGRYGSCMSGGSCNNSTIGTPTGSPHLMLDLASAHFIAYPLVMFAAGATFGEYYNTTEGYSQMDVWKDQRLFGGNGDGTLFYPNSDLTPSPSLRLLLVGFGLRMIEWLNALKIADPTTYSTLVTPVFKDAFTWSKNEGDYFALRAKVIAALIAAGKVKQV